MEDKLDILAFGAHPDDVELSCSGTIVKHIKQGKTVGVFDLTMGELGTRGSGSLRLEESNTAKAVMGLAVRGNLGMADGFFTLSKENKLKVAQIIRKYRPDVVLCNAVNDRHPDHGKGAKLVSDACFLAGLVKIETRAGGQLQEAWRPNAVYHYIQDHYIKPDFVVDISEFMEAKMASIMAYESQFYNPDSEEPDTPISSEDFVDFIKARSRDFGRLINVKYGEGFTVERGIGVEDICALG